MAAVNQHQLLQHNPVVELKQVRVPRIERNEELLKPKPTANNSIKVLLLPPKATIGQRDSLEINSKRMYKVKVAISAAH